MAFNPASAQNGHAHSPQPYLLPLSQSGYPAVQGYTYPAAPSSGPAAFSVTPAQGYSYPSIPGSGQPAFHMSPLPGYTYPPAPNSSPAAFIPPYYNQYPNPPHQAFSQSAYPAPSQPVYAYPPAPNSGPVAFPVTPAQGYAYSPVPGSSQPAFQVTPSPYGGYPNTPPQPQSFAQPGYVNPSAPSSNPHALFASPQPASSSAVNSSSSAAIAPSCDDGDYRIPQGSNISLDTIIKRKPSTQEKRQEAREQAWIANYKGSMFPPVTPITVDKSRKIPGVLVDKINFPAYQACDPTPDEILYYLDEKKPVVHYKYLDVLGNVQRGTMPLIDVNSKYKGVLAQKSSSSAGSASKLYVDLNQELKEPIWKRIQKGYIESLRLKEIEANDNRLPAPGEVLYSVKGLEVECQYWVLEDSVLNLVKKGYTKKDFYSGSGEAEILSRISAQVKLIFDLAEYLRTNKQEENSDLKTAKASVTEKLIAYLKDRANADIPTFSQQEIDSIYSGFWSCRLGDLVDRAKEIYPGLKYVLKPAHYAPS